MTIDRSFRISQVNLALLDAELRASLGEQVTGVSVLGETVTIHFADEPAGQVLDQAAALVNAHDATRLTPQQQADLDRQEHPFFKLPAAELVIWAETRDSTTFQREVAQAFTYLREILE